MRLGIITSRERFFLNDFLEKYTFSGIEYDFAHSVDGFVKEFGTDRHYDGFLIHPAHGCYNFFIGEFRKNFPSVKTAFVTHDLGGSITIEDAIQGMPAFDYSDIKGIKKYFSG